MVFKIEINPKVEKELDQAYNYHFEHSPEKALRLIKEFTDCLDVLKTNPFFEIRYDNIRSLYLGKGLDYTMFFTIDERVGSIRILALLHSSVNFDKYPD